MLPSLISLLTSSLPANLFQFSNPPPLGHLMKLDRVKTHNEMSVEFNRPLKDRVAKLTEELKGAAVVYLDVHAAKHGLIANAKGLCDNFQRDKQCSRPNPSDI
ncbi:unnamed protein product [Linum tenue]|uniref:Uncharacterized protein n=1 Tax=Linum tenue TaxID=586396 RepID=A0AAV0N878_9ROSI|nr:unnamed protein product [Linum tenue]